MINTKLLMGASALLMAMLGIGGTFFPQEVLGYLGGVRESGAVIVVQIAGALYIGFAVQNWMARENLIGGVYSRPVALGNFLHFFVVAIALVRTLISTVSTAVLVGLFVAYSLLALCFAVVLFTHPVRDDGRS